MTEKDNFFPNPVFRKKLTVETLESLQRFVQYQALEPTTNFANSTKNGFQSDEKLFSLKAPEILLLKSEIFACISEYFPDFYLANTRKNYTNQPIKFDLWGWLTKLEEGGFNSPHIHPRSTISGVYYVKTPQKILENTENDFAGWLGFLDPRANAQMWPLQEHVTYNFISPDPGSIVLFPSYLPHFVPPFKGEGERISIAFNLRHKQ